MDFCDNEPSVQNIYSVDDLLLGEVLDDVPIKVPDLQYAQFCTPLVQGRH